MVTAGTLKRFGVRLQEQIHVPWRLRLAMFAWCVAFSSFSCDYSKLGTTFRIFAEFCSNFMAASVYHPSDADNSTSTDFVSRVAERGDRQEGGVCAGGWVSTR